MKYLFLTILVLTSWSLMAQAESSLDLEPTASAEDRTLMAAGQLPLVWFEWQPELNGAFQPGGDMSVLRNFSDLKAQFTFHRGNRVLDEDGLESYLGSPQNPQRQWLPSYQPPPQRPDIPEPDVTIQPALAYAGAAAGFVATLALLPERDEELAQRSSSYDETRAVIAVGGLILGAGAGYLLDALFQSPSIAKSKAQYEEEVLEYQANLPPAPTEFPENFQNMEVLILRIKEHNSKVLSEPKYSILGIPSGTVMSEVVAEYGEPDSLSATNQTITATYFLAEYDRAILEYSLGGVLLDVALN
jgi:hypothetical protein